MSLTHEEITYLAGLSRIKVEGEDMVRLAEEVGSILDYVSSINAVELITPTPDAHHNVVRADAITHEGGIHTERLLACAPLTNGSYVQVAKVL